MYEKTHGNGLIEWLFNFERTDLSTVHLDWMNTRSLKIAQ